MLLAIFADSTSKIEANGLLTEAMGSLWWMWSSRVKSSQVKEGAGKQNDLADGRSKETRIAEIKITR